ncbi:DapH/DapD/GlmU-related protein [Cellulomonas sp. URHE0023]|uniref:acyltransferase n=1 Tax=Cellulomonas sp. URHE0023 TaxID=1380354 RepID=UPI0005550F87|nr:acyltransferase [Cellulomonas sp. URHE0023]
MAPDAGLELDFAPWEWDRRATPHHRVAMAGRLDALRARGYVLGAGCLVSSSAAVDADRLELGDRTYVAAHVHVTGDVVLGADCSVNVGAAVRGRVRTGDGVRIGASSSLLGFNHGFDDPDVPVFRQPLTSAGIEVGDDVWIGAHAVVLDGVRIGAHAVVGAGAVVTRDVPDWAIVVGNPARQVGDRRETGRRADASSRLRARTRAAREQVPGIVRRSWSGDAYGDAPSASPTVRAHCDAIELADLVGGPPPPELSLDEHVRRLSSWQDAATGLVPSLSRGDAGPTAGPFPDHAQAYHVLCVGYALDLLGSRLPHPVAAVTSLAPDALVTVLDGLPWATNAWGAGAVVDSIGTALAWSPMNGPLAETVVRWLDAARDPGTGLWGSCASGLREPVNGTYRLVRGTYASWGPRTGGNDAMVDTVLRRGADTLESACDVLDVAYLLWWAGPEARARRARDIADLGRHLLDVALGNWVEADGAPFVLGGPPTLQGTEMWLATTWYLAQICGLGSEYGLRPRGIHRPHPLRGPAAHPPTPPAA